MAFGLQKFDGLADFEVVPLFNPGNPLFGIIGADQADEVVGLGIARFTVNLVGFRRPRYGEAAGIRPVGDFFQFLEPFRADREVFGIGFIGVRASR